MPSPYAQQAARLLQSHGKLMLIDCHSYPVTKLPYEGDKLKKRPDICLGVNDIHASQDLIDFWRSACSKWNLSFAVNEPFSGVLVPKALERHPKVLAFMIEINKNTYLMDGRLQPSYLYIKSFLDTQLSLCFSNAIAFEI